MWTITRAHTAMPTYTPKHTYSTFIENTEYVKKKKKNVFNFDFYKRRHSLTLRNKTASVTENGQTKRGEEVTLLCSLTKRSGGPLHRSLFLFAYSLPSCIILWRWWGVCAYLKATSIPLYTVNNFLFISHVSCKLSYHMELWQKEKYSLYDIILNVAMMRSELTCSILV